MYQSNLLWQTSTTSESLRRESERSLARAAARWSRRLRGGGAERVGVEPTRA